MTTLYLEDGSLDRKHRDGLASLLASTKGIVRIASAYVTDRHLVSGLNGRPIRLLVSLLPMDVASGATSLETLRWMIESGVECRVLPDRPRLHAKTYILGTAHAVITSANLTGNGLDSNIEAGVELQGRNVTELIGWFDKHWGNATLLTDKQLAEIGERTEKLRKEFVKLRRFLPAKVKREGGSGRGKRYSDSLLALFDSAEKFFVCNSNRRYDVRTSTGGFGLEQEMYNRGLATAWEPFKFPGHMEQVEPGHAIFMYAKGIGIVGVGVATASCEVLLDSEKGRLRLFKDGNDTPEWRVPTKWLAWTDDAGAYQCKGQNFTFWDVTGADYDELRMGVRSHFLEL